MPSSRPNAPSTTGRPRPHRKSRPAIAHAASGPATLGTSRIIRKKVPGKPGPLAAADRQETSVTVAVMFRELPGRPRQVARVSVRMPLKVVLGAQPRPPRMAPRTSLRSPPCRAIDRMRRLRRWCPQRSASARRSYRRWPSGSCCRCRCPGGSSWSGSWICKETRAVSRKEINSGSNTTSMASACPSCFPYVALATLPPV